MELNTLLNALIQGAETGVLSQVASDMSAQPGGGASAQSGLSTFGPPGAQLGTAAQSAPGTSVQPGGLSSGVPPGTNTAAQPGLSAFVARSGANAAPQPGSNASAQQGPSVSVQPGPGLSGTTQQAGTTPQSRGTGNSSAGGSEDVYYGSSDPASPSLLNQSGVSAYVQLLGALTSSEQSGKNAEALTNHLLDASASLKFAYNEALSSLPAPLQQKDWSFSLSNGNLVFTGGKDALTAQDMADLQKAFAASNVAAAARQVSAALVVIDQKVKSGADASSLAWGRFEADESNSGDAVNLRAYVTATVPGGKYDPGAAEAAHSLLVPATLGGMYLRDLISARPSFSHAKGSQTAAAVDGLEEPLGAVDVSTLEGQCSCGEVRFNVENDFEYAFYCHCSRCRLRTGSAFAAIAGIALDKVQITAGRESLEIEGECSEGYGARCSRCHAFLFAAVRNRQYMHVSLGVLAGTPNRVPDQHIYVGSKAPWYRITDDLPQYDELP